MTIKTNTSLKEFNTFGLDVKADFLIEYNSVVDLKAVLLHDIVKSNPILHIGGGSNLLFLKDFNAVILHSKIQDINIISDDDDAITIEVGSGVIWDDFVALAVEKNWYGIENLSLIPGETGAAAIQNIGAYGVEIKDCIEKVKCIEVATGNEFEFSNQACEYGYRESIFKKSLKGKYIVCFVLFRLSKKPTFNLNYQHLEAQVLQNGAINLQNIRKTIIEVRESKLPDTKVLGNAGSFFMNPVVEKSQFLDLQKQYPEMPHYFVSDTHEKIPAAWLIDQCGWKGKSIGNAAVHDKQALVIVNKGNATGAEIAHLAQQIQLSVFDKFAVDITPEVNYI
jgi:UDP-N-acetylmuramate dehydrogenase